MQGASAAPWVPRVGRMRHVPTNAARRRSVPAWVLALVVLLGVALGWWIGQPGDRGGPTASATSAVATSASPGPATGAGSPTDPATTSASSSPTTARTPRSGLPTIAETALPSQARDTLALIHAGGPFPYDKDGAVFQNRERILPLRPTGYYHEYTVPKPGESDRGPWRLVAGDDGDVYWTADHYDSFQQVQEGT